MDSSFIIDYANIIFHLMFMVEDVSTIELFRSYKQQIIPFNKLCRRKYGRTT